MLTQRLRHVLLGPAGKVLGVGLSVWLLAAPPAAALEDTALVLMGGQATTGGQTRFLAPGTPFNQTADFPGVGLGEQSVQLRLPKGQLRDLRVNLTTETVPTGGSFTLMVRVNGANTLLTCSVAATGDCNSTKKVNLAAGSRVAIRTVNTLTDAGNTIFTYTLIYD